MTDAGEQDQSSEAPEQLTGPGQARLLVEQTNVGQAPDTVDNSSRSQEEAAFRGGLK